MKLRGTLWMLIFISYTEVNCSLTNDSDESYFDEELKIYSTKALEERLLHGLLHYGRTGVISKELNKDLEKLKLLPRLSQIPFSRFHYKKELTQIKELTLCSVCNIAANILLTYREFGGGKDFVSSVMKLMCYQIEPIRVCDGLIDLNIDTFLFIMDRKPDLTSSKICNIIAQPFNCKNDDEKHTWSVNLAEKVTKNPKITENSSPNTYDKPIRILQITDMHYDYKYKAGGNAKCDEPLCCGEDQGNPSSPENAAGAWGEYHNCDMPLNVIENMMDVASKHDIDFVYHTGDIINHRNWETSRKTNLKSILEVHNLFRTKFPNKTVYNIIGNHEPNPLNLFSPEYVSKDELSTNWLFHLMAEEWSTWLPKQTQETIRRGGYYTILVRPGFRIVAINSNVCFVYNWWLLYNDDDPYDQLQWLSDTLYEAELNDEVVHILSHIPAGDKECYKKWSHEYNRIIRRYADIIKGQFVGHTHYSELHFFYEDNKKDPINVQFNAGSITTYKDVNPNYRIYEVNPNTYQIEDYEDWIYNITEAKKNTISVSPRWYKLFSFKEAYGLSSMNMTELGKFAISLATNSRKIDTYFRFKVSNSDPFLIVGCNQKCNEENLCNLVTSEFGETKTCNKLLGIYRQTL